MSTFKGILLNKTDAGFNASLADIDEAQLPADGDVTVAIEYSTLNYKDGLAITNKSPVVRKWPMVAGIDGAGTVESSNHPDWKAGDKVIHTGFGVGESHWGCLAEKARLLEHKAATDEHLAASGIPVSYTNVFWGGRSEIKPSEISPQLYRRWLVEVGQQDV